MSNQEISQIFKNIALILEIKEESRFRIVAYEKAAQEVDFLANDLEDIYKKGGIKALDEIPGIGQSISEKLEELFKTGKIKAYEDLKKEVPESVLELTQVSGIGPKTAFAVYKGLGIKSIKDLEKAAKLGKIKRLPHFKATSEKNILRGIEQYRARKKERERMLLPFAEPIANETLSFIKKIKEVKRADIVGSLRRWKETIGDLDIIIASDNPRVVIEKFKKADFVKRVIASGDTKISVLNKLDVRIDLEILTEKNYIALLHHFTGSKAHNVALRTWAKQKGIKISEYGIEKNGKEYNFKTEEDFFKFLGMEYIPPELREDWGEIESALKNQLPKLIEEKDIKGDLHTHTNQSDGNATIEEMAKVASLKGYKYFGISDHTAGLGVASGLNDKQLLKHRDNIKKINKKLSKINLLASAEVNITAKGGLDISETVLKKLDYVIGSVHSAFNQEESAMTKRLLKVINGRKVHIIGHPSGRLLGERIAYDLDWEEIFKACAKNKVALEISSFPNRLDLKDSYIKQAKEFGVVFAINTDSHNKEHLDLIKYGVHMARRGWAEKADIINAWEFNKLIKWFE